MNFLKNVVGSFLEIGIFFIFGVFVYLLVLWGVDSSRLYYDGLIAVLVIIIFSYLIIFLASRYLNFSHHQFTQRSLLNAALAASTLVYAFHITVPTIIDRSISLYILSRMDGKSSGVNVGELQESFLNGYVSKNNAVCRRLDEQIVSGNIRFENGKYFITDNGERVINILRVVARLVHRSEYYVTESMSDSLLYKYKIENGQCLNE